MKTWITADTHFNHTNILRNCKRPFSSVKIMNDTLVRNWNARVNEHDIVIHLGDFSFGDPKKWLSLLHGHITILRGNHDKNNSLNTKIEYLVVKVDNNEVFCVHRPEDYSSSYRINLVAHVHEKWLIRKVYNSYLVNVGVDVNAFHPIDLNEILRIISNFKREEKG